MRRSRERGQGLVEFAVIFPVFVLILFAVIDGGLVMGRYGQVNHAASVGARLGAVQTGDADDAVDTIADRVEQDAPDRASPYARSCNFSSSSAAICVQWLPGPDGEPPGQAGSWIRVAVKYHYGGITPLLGQLGGWDVKACVVARQEQPVTGVAGSQTSNASDCSGAGGGS
jgi:hypothetical protein